MNVSRFFRKSLKRSTNIVRRVGSSTRKLASGALKRGESFARRVGRTTRKTLRLKRRQ